MELSASIANTAFNGHILWSLIAITRVGKSISNQLIRIPSHRSGAPHVD
jgi:hypothetical protein